MPVYGSHVSSTVCPDDRQRDTRHSVEVVGGADTAVTKTRVTMCSTDTQTETDKDIESDILFRHTDDTSVYPFEVMTKARRKSQSTDTPTHVDKYQGYTAMCKQELKEREAAQRSDSSRRGYPGLTESVTPPLQMEPWRRIRNNKHPPDKLEISKGYTSSSRSQRERWTSVTVEEGGLPLSISHLNQGYGHTVFDSVTGRKHRDLHAKSGSRTGIHKVQLKNESKKKHITRTPLCPDPELVRIYGGTKQTAWNLHKSQRKKRNVHLFSLMPNYSSQGRRTGERCLENDSASTHQSYISHRDGTDSSTSTKDTGRRCTLDAKLNDHELNMGETLSVKRREHSVFRCAINGRHGLLKPISPLPEQHTPVPRDTGHDRSPVSTDVMGNVYIKGILKSPTEKSRDNEPSPAHHSCSENVATRRVRFEEKGYLDKSYETLELDKLSERYDRTSVGHTNIRPREQNHVSLTQSHNIETEHYLKSSGFTISSPLHFGDVATKERNLPVIQHFRDVGDYDELYPGNGGATRWNDICIDWGTLETRASADVNAGGFTRRPKGQMTDTFASGQTAPDSARSAISNVSNEESDGRASGDGCSAYGTVNRVTVEHHNDRGYDDGMPLCQYSCLMSDGSDPQADIHKEHEQSTPTSRDLRNTSLETSQRQQKAIENLERALKHGVLHASLSNLPISYKGGSTLRHMRNFNTEGHVDLIDMKALDERVSTPRREKPPPPCTRYRSMYDYASKNNSNVWSVDHTRTSTISHPLFEPDAV
ncbi:uncharacterized protein LOC110460881 isoform X2 [Mizuhopecten yessoensis]|uniref:uncharacterized protein LOC110460881 isoform X2 n=1 Tax=Mizuhopecten yessoensis TaxID=6573 RepID=UPI000B45EDA3|nr:uncharacterized protein LOC110460881 isoform X2 [Mizuhopecten yessoensis]